MPDIPNNPFPLEGVATYGAMNAHYKGFGYVTQATSELQAYLMAYPRSDRRYGGSVGLQGGHGSGKTHVLNAIAAEAAAYQKTLQPVVVYAKADRASFLDLYAQLMTDLKRTRIQQLIGQALLAIAQETVTQASVTENISDRIQEPGDITQLILEGNLDQGQLRASLRQRLVGPLQEKGIPETLPEMLLLAGSPSLGEAAFEWLSGKDVANLAPLGVPVQLRGLVQDDGESSGPDVTAINAIETVAALHGIARRPFIVLIDQMEVLFRAEGTRLQAMFSGIKKLTEQLGRRDALLYLAGNPDSWESLPRDVPPRLRSRAPILVGNLTEQQSQFLLEAWGRGAAVFSADAVKRIHRLAGGSPREILRIAHQAFKATQGDVAVAGDDILVQAATDAGSLADQEEVALTLVDKALTEWEKRGDLIRDIDTGEGSILHRVLRVNGHARLGVVTLRATDSVDEARTAKRVLRVFQYLQEKWPGAAGVVIAIGYGSQDVARLLGRASTVLEFNEYTLSRQLRRVLLELDTAPVEEAVSRPADPDFQQKFDRILKSLDSLEEQRKQDANRAAERFSQSAQKAEEPARQKREVRTRWDMRAEIDEIAAEKSPDVQKERMESVLVANETILKSKMVEILGDAFLEAISIEKQFPGRLKEVSREGSGSGKSLVQIKAEILHDTLEVLRVDPLPIRRHPGKLAAVGMGVYALAAVAYVVAFPTILRQGLPMVALILSPLLAGAGAYWLLVAPVYRAQRRWRWQLGEAQAALRTASQQSAARYRPDGSSGYDVYMSYAKEDKEEVSQIVKVLNDNSLRAFLDTELRAGDVWEAELEKALKGARATCVCVGPAGRISDWRQHEIEMAVAWARDKSEYRVIPVLLPRSDPDNMPLFLRGRQWLDLRSGITAETVRPLLVALS